MMYWARLRVMFVDDESCRHSCTYVTRFLYHVVGSFADDFGLLINCLRDGIHFLLSRILCGAKHVVVT